MDPAVPIVRLREMDAVFAQSISRPRLLSQLVAAFAALYAEDCTVETQIAGTIKGRAEVAAKEQELFAMFPDVTTTIEETTIMGSRAFVTATISGTDEGGAFAPAA